MTKPYDSSLKSHIDFCQAAWAGWFAGRLGLPSGPVGTLDSDLSTSVQADKLFLLGEPPAAALHLELLTGPPRDGVGRFLEYNVLAGVRVRLPVHTVALLLRPEAQSAEMTGHYTRRGLTGAVYLEFHYEIIRVWREPLRDLLDGPWALWPLALLTDEAAVDPAAVVAELERKVPTIGDARLERQLWTTALILSGMRYDRAWMKFLFGRAREMRESAGYQMILDEGRDEGRVEGRVEGRIEQMQDDIQLLGTDRWGPPPEFVLTELRSITNVDRLKRMIGRLLRADDWADLLGTN